MLLVIATPPLCERIEARAVEKEEISPLMLLWSVRVEIYPNVPRPTIVLVIAGWSVDTEEIYPNVPRPTSVDVIAG